MRRILAIPFAGACLAGMLDGPTDATFGWVSVTENPRFLAEDVAAWIVG